MLFVLLLDLTDSTLVAEMQMEHAKCALAAGIKFLQLLSDKNQSNRFHLKTHQPDLYMRLDKAAMIALNIFPDQRQRPDFSELRKSGESHLHCSSRCQC